MIASEATPNSLTERELELARQVAKTYRSLMKADCTGCRYCLPCPAGVAIPVCLQIYNGRHALRDRHAGRSYAMFAGGVLGPPSKASLCTDCGACLEKCPQHLPIPELLKDVAAEFEGPLLPPATWLLKKHLAFSRWWTRRGLARYGQSDSRDA